ncbi:MAG TPA: hypothetical protein V6C89_09950 [Drouetiella sp.]|jgi:hypothetical protein
MVVYKAPKFFAERERKPAAGSNQVLHVVDRFFMDRGFHAPSEVCVLLNSDGYLELAEISDQRPLTNRIATQLSFDEVANRKNQRQVRVSSLHLMNVHMIEQPVNTEGIDDPIILQGTMTYAFGPVKEVLSGDLMVSRGDVLNALLEGSSSAFEYAVEAGRGRASRCFHLMLPGNRLEATTHGIDLVLAYPLLPIELIDKSPGNETLIQKMLLEMLMALQKDLQEENTNHPLVSTDLEGMDRDKCIQNLIDDGFTVDGDLATRSKYKTPWSSVNELMESLGALGFGGKIEQQLPPENCLDELLHLTATTIAKIPSWPPASATAVRNRYRRMV